MKNTRGGDSISTPSFAGPCCCGIDFDELLGEFKVSECRLLWPGRSGILLFNSSEAIEEDEEVVRSVEGRLLKWFDRLLIACFLSCGDKSKELE